MTIKTSFAGSLLRSSTAISALVIAGIATPAFAQDATNPAPPPETSDVATQQSNPEAVASQQPASSPAATTPAENNGREIVVTGTILRQVAKATPSPVTTINTEQLDRRGLSTVQDALQQLGSNNGPAITANFSTNGAFAQGASGASLRGLSTNSTLTLFDGLRAAYYPLADDGSRNFVDLNTIPDDIIDRVDVLRDGASSSYGADAIAGVINLITKREFSGLAARIEGGVSSRGDGDSRKASITAGVGDLATNGANAYISGFYYKADGILNKDRPYPFNTDDQSRICYNGVCGPNGIINGVNNDGTTSFNTYDTFYVRPRSATGGSVGVTRYNLLNGCNPGQTPYTLTPEQLADPNNAAAPANGQVCQTDFTNQFGHITGDIKRFGFSSRATVLIGDNHEAYALFNFMQTRTSSEGGAPVIRGNAPAGVFYPRFSTSTGAGAVAPGSAALALPIYVCPTGVGTANGVNTGCTATTPGAILNPYNPYAALGQTAQIIGRPSGLRTQSSTRNRAYRAALGFKGTVFGGWDYDLSATWMHTDLQTKAEGFFYIQNFLDAVARGQFNFLNPSATAPDILDRIAPDKINNNSSDLRQAQLIVGRELMQLPGGPLQLGLGATIFREAVNAPSANSDINGPTQRYFTLNAFGAKGSRVVKAVFAELEAPVMPWFSLNASGRYDHYSTGQSAFSPKLGFKLTPVRQVLFRGTWSKGFRIPAFAEANSFPTTGFVTASKGIYTDSFLAQYGCSLATYTSCPTYLTQATYGLTQVANENLKPEKSRSYTAGLLVEPIRNWSATVDYYNIKKTGAILFPETGPAIAAYYSGQPIPPGFVVIPDAPDPNNPTATPKIAFVEAGLVNAATQRVWGLDFGVQGRVAVTPGIRWITQGEASYIGRLETKFPSGNVERYDGTLGNFNLTAGSGTPKWKGYWANTLDFGRVQATGTVNYFGGYDLSAMDQGGDYKDCSLNPGYVPCKVKRYITFDVNAQVRLTDQVSVYGSVLNIFNKMPPIDPVTYGSHLFNAVQGGTGILGTYFKLGAKLDLAGPKLRVAEAEYVAPPPPPPPPPPAAPATVTCPDGLVILAGQQCPSPPPPPPPPPPAPERGY